MSDVFEIIQNLPDVQEVQKWARAIVVARGDAYSDWLHKGGLHIESTKVLCDPDTQIARENVGNPAQGGTNIITLIELAVYPATEFSPIWDEPNRTWDDVPVGLGGRRYNCILHALTGPTLARVIETNYGTPEVRYTLYEMEPIFQQKAAESTAVRAARGLTPTQEWGAWLRGEL